MPDFKRYMTSRSLDFQAFLMLTAVTESSVSIQSRKKPLLISRVTSSLQCKLVPSVALSSAVSLQTVGVESLPFWPLPSPASLEVSSRPFPLDIFPASTLAGQFTRPSSLIDLRSLRYVNSFVEGVGLGAGTMLAPTYVAENSPRAIRGFLVGFFQLLLVMGGMMSYFINYGALLHLPVSQF